MSRLHQFDDYKPGIFANEHELERIMSCKLLGVYFVVHLRWNDHINHTISACYATLQVLRKLKHLTAYSLTKWLAETLILIQISLWQHHLLSIATFSIKTPTSFVLDHSVKNQEGVLQIGWLTINERRDLNILKLFQSTTPSRMVR